MPPSDVSRREFDIDPFRGYVCLMLLLFHFWFDRLHDAIAGPTADFAVTYLRLGVESFFVLAGFMVAHTLRPMPGEEVALGKYFLRRVVRLLVPYWIAVLLASANYWLPKLLGGTAPHARPWDEILSQLFLFQEFYIGEPHKEASVGFWSLVTLEQFYLIWLCVIAVARTIFRTSEGRSTAMAWVALVGVGASLYCVATVPSGHWELPHWLAYLLLGVLLYEAVTRGIGVPACILAVLAVGFVGLTLDPKYYGVKALAAALLLAGSARGMTFPNSLVTRCLRWVGKRSYSVYLTHGIVGYRVFSLYPKVERFGTAGAVGLFMVAVAGSMVAAAVFYRVVELPCLRWARTVKYRNAKPTVVA